IPPFQSLSPILEFLVQNCQLGIFKPEKMGKIRPELTLGAAQGEVLVLDSEDEMSVVMDFALREYKVNKQTTVEIYQEK
ncbi:MAG: hypothetical protein QSU88_02430, partial [Candidatus Methanoperedens sp.]|nr:hypothetical protein [Candidatus Methanoperedens sp.]